MREIAGYEVVQQIYDSETSLIYQGRHPISQRPVILKVLKQAGLNPVELTRYKQEYAITQQLAGTGVIQVLGLEEWGPSWVMILEDFGGRSLAALSDGQPWTIANFLRVAIPITAIVGRIHRAQVIHKDLNPQNIIWNPQNDCIKLIDFGISTQFGRENPTLQHPGILEGTLAYLSPEQTGRMNRVLDYRSDFYSLGVTFYQLLTGQLPFKSQDALELVHCHIAKQPTAPHLLCPSIPPALSDIVMKLMAKTAEERYQSAWGIQADLEHCLDQLQTKGRIDAFPLATKDRSAQFQIPQKLYGRAGEVAELLGAFERVAAAPVEAPSPSELMLVAGYSGIGKSSLVQEIYKPVTRSRGAFITGKFDQFQRNVPYSAIVSAFRSLMRQLVAVPQEELHHWQTRLQQALGHEGQVIVEVIPEVEWIIGQQPALPDLPPTESQTRFNQVFQNFIQVFCTPEHPLVMFLDDLQWADAATLKLMHRILVKSQIRHLFLIGAYRDNEVDPSHPFRVMVDDLCQAGVRVNQITLAPLAIAPISQLVADTLHMDVAAVRSLAEFLIKQTEGNPFFVSELLKTLHQEALLTFQDDQHCHPLDAACPCWHWDIAQIEARGITDNVVELMIDKLKQLPLATQQVLSLAACIGANFDLNTLSIVCERSPQTVYHDLLVAIQPGLVLTQSALDPQLLIQHYRFGHDRIQQAAYTLIDTESRQAVHLKIGQLLLQNSTAEAIDERLFEIVDHLNLGMEQVTAIAERFEMAQLNLKAARKAKGATAYEASLAYVKASMAGVDEETWATQFDWMLALHRERTDLEFLNGDFEASQRWIDATLAHARTDLEKADIYIHRMVLSTLSGRYAEALEVGCYAATLLGMEVPQGNPEPLIQAGMADIADALAGRTIADLVHLPPMSDPVKILSMKLLGEFIPTSYLARQELFPWVNVTMVQLSLQYGLHPDGFVGFACYGMILASVAEAYSDAYEFGKVALALSQRWNNALQTCRACHILSSFLMIWVKPVRESGDIKRLGGKGDLTYAGYNQAEYLANLWFEGQPLGDILAEIEIVQLDLQKFANQYTETITAAFRYSVVELLNQPEAQILYDQHPLTEAEFIHQCETKKLQAGLCTHYILRGILAYLDGDMAAADAQLRQAEALILTRRATMVVPVFYFYHCLVLAEQYHAAIAQPALLQEIDAKLDQLQRWATSCPDNFEHLCYLVQAEVARCREQPLVALDLYDQGIASAAAQGFIHHAALGQELAGRFWLAKGKPHFAQLYLQRAHAGYQRWGASRKVNQLEQIYSAYLSPLDERSAAKPGAGKTVETSRKTDSDRLSSILDLQTILKASQTLSSELILSEFLHGLIEIVIENAGAQFGYLLLAPQLGQGLEGASAQPATAQQHLAISASNVAAVRQGNGCVPLEQAAQQLPISVIYYVARTQESLILNYAQAASQFAGDVYIQTQRPKSMLGMPIMHHNVLLGVLYLENNLTADAFTGDRLEVLNLLMSQAAISLQNALLYDTLEQKVAQRTQELNAKNQSLTDTLAELQRTQSQLVQSEKMSSLGQLVAGIAHEINNPVNFIHGNLNHLKTYWQDLLVLLQAYQQDVPQPSQAIQAQIDAMDLPFLREDLPKVLQSMQMGTERIRAIVLSLRNFSRLDESVVKAVDLHEGIDNTLLILQHRLQATPLRPAIKVIKEYGPLPAIECHAGQLNQVFMNLISNAIDALEGLERSRGLAEPGGLPAQEQSNLPPPCGRIYIQTEVMANNAVKVMIADNGTGFSEAVQSRLFDPFFTTKPVGKGTGLGLSISYQIITGTHKGKLYCHSIPGEGTQFYVEIPINPSELATSAAP
jgi:predicted ATPase/signal transduction histidine kinase